MVILVFIIIGLIIFIIILLSVITAGLSLYLWITYKD